MSVQDQRPRFFEGQYLGAADLETAITYGQVRDARHLLGAHTWGIAAGLWLIERAVPGTTGVDVYLEPGYAWDGFGRPIVVLARYRIPAALFADVKYDPLLDAAGKGRLLPVYVRYDERPFQNPAPGFGACEDDDQRSRVQETFAIAVGEQSEGTHGSISIDGRSVAADTSTARVNPASRIFYDESAPAQTLPEGPDARWLVPVGYVRWLPAATGPGRFVARDDTQAHDSDDIRRFRRYAGIVAEEILAADRVLRVRDRSRRPSDRFRIPPACDPNETDPAKMPDNDLLFVEGATRVEGDVRLVGGALDLLTSGATDRGAPLRIRRTERPDPGATTSNQGPAAIEIVTSVAGQQQARLAVGPLTKADPTSGLDEKLTVMSGGNVGVSNPSPAVKLHVIGERARLESADTKKRIDLVTEKTGVDLLSDTNNLYIHGTGAPNNNHVLLNPLADEGNVGVGNEEPAAKLHVTGARARLEDADKKKRIDLATDNAGVDLLSDTDNLYVHATGTQNNVLLNPLPGEGNVGIGTDAPTHKLHVKSTSGVRQNALYLSGNTGWSSISYNAHHNEANTAWVYPDVSRRSVTIEMDDTGGKPRFQVYSIPTAGASWQSHFAIDGSTDTISMAYTTDGKVGVGTATPQQKLHVVGKRIRLENADGSKRLDLRTDGGAVDLHSETTSLYLRSSGTGAGNNNVIVNHLPSDGSVGIGTDAPKAKLHVSASKAGDEHLIDSHVTVIENASSSLNADVLALKVGTGAPGPSNNFITFFAGGSPIGCIQANSTHTGVSYKTSGADFAECLPLEDGSAQPQPGDVVGIFEGRASLRTAGAHHVSAVTAQPVVLGNAPADPRTPHASVAFVGQVPVKVRGRVCAGDWIVTSALEDGTAVAVAPMALDVRAAENVVGQAWESSDEERVKLVKTAVGVRPNAGVSGLANELATQQAKIEALERQIQRLRRGADAPRGSDR